MGSDVTKSPAAGPVMPQGSGAGAGRQTRLSSMEEQRHKPLCFGSAGGRWQCLAAAISPGELWFEQSYCFLETSQPRCDLGVLQGLQGGLCGAPMWMPFAATEREHCGAGAEQGFPNAWQPIETAVPSGRSAHLCRVLPTAWVSFPEKKSTVHSCLWF